MMNTPHINLKNNTGFAKTVLMPGDPLRAKMIAESFLENPVLINDIRGILGYTGYYNSRKISVMASGMGIPSMAIYSYELYSFFGVENIIRVGTCGGLSKETELRDIIAANCAITDSSYISRFGYNKNDALPCSSELFNCVSDCAKRLGMNLKSGKIFTTDAFYDFGYNYNKEMAEKGALAVEMETAGLYMNALKLHKNALAIYTVSDLPLNPDVPGCTAEERQKAFTDMIKLALEAATVIEDKENR